MRHQTTFLFIFHRKGDPLCHNCDMNTSKLVVTVALYTVLEDFNLGTVPLSLVSVGERSDRFGMGLFVLTRKTNSIESHTSQSKRVLPATEVRPDEGIEEAAYRLLESELGLTAPVKLRQERIFDDPNREAGQRVISVTFWGFANLEDVAPVLGGKEQVGLELVNSSEFLDSFFESHGSDEIDGVCRFGLRLVPDEKQGHDKRSAKDLGWGPILDIDHDEMVFVSWRRLRYGFGGKLDPFRFLGAKALPEAFRLSDLRELSDICRGERSQADQFRRSVLNESSFITPSVGFMEKQKRPGKPAVLYSLQEWADPSSQEPNS